jgi:hypothetical protein
VAAGYIGEALQDDEGEDLVLELGSIEGPRISQAASQSHAFRVPTSMPSPPRCLADRNLLMIDWVGGDDCLHPDDSGYAEVSEIAIAAALSQRSDAKAGSPVAAGEPAARDQRP